MRQTDINARQSAVNNEEKLAALGLNMSARGQAATSGMAETSRIAVDNRYRSDLNSLGRRVCPRVRQRRMLPMNRPQPPRAATIPHRKMRRSSRRRRH